MRFSLLTVLCGTLFVSACGSVPATTAAPQRPAIVTWNPNICEADLLIQRGQIVVQPECGYYQRWRQLTPQAKVVFCENVFEKDRYTLSQMESTARQFIAYEYGVRSYLDCQRMILERERPAPLYRRYERRW